MKFQDPFKYWTACKSRVANLQRLLSHSLPGPCHLGIYKFAGVAIKGDRPNQLHLTEWLRCSAHLPLNSCKLRIDMRPTPPARAECRAKPWSSRSFRRLLPGPSDDQSLRWWTAIPGERCWAISDRIGWHDGVISHLTQASIGSDEYKSGRNLNENQILEETRLTRMIGTAVLGRDLGWSQLSRRPVSVINDCLSSRNYVVKPQGKFDFFLRSFPICWRMLDKSDSANPGRSF